MLSTENPEALAAEAARLRQEAHVLREQAKGLADKANAMEELATACERMAGIREKRLTTVEDNATVNAMNAREISSNALRSRAKAKYPDNKFIQAMADDGDTVAVVASFLTDLLKRPFHRNVVQAWYVPVGEPSHRDIPRDAAEALRDRYGKFTNGAHKGAWRVPVDSWPRVRG